MKIRKVATAKVATAPQVVADPSRIKRLRLIPLGPRCETLGSQLDEFLRNNPEWREAMVRYEERTGALPLAQVRLGLKLLFREIDVRIRRAGSAKRQADS
jgi:hypothetical protein